MTTADSRVGLLKRPRVLLAWCLVKTIVVVAALLFFTALGDDLSGVIYQNF